MNKEQLELLKAQRTAGTITAEDLVLLETEEKRLMDELAKAEAERLKGTDSTLVAPLRHDVNGVVMDISEPIRAIVKGVQQKNADGSDRLYHIVSFKDMNGTKRTWATAPGFLLRNKTRFVPGASVTLSVETRIAGKTQWVDRQTGVVGTHKSSGESIVGVTLSDIDFKKTNNAEYNSEMVVNKLKDIDNPVLANAVATYFGTALK